MKPSTTNHPSSPLQRQRNRLTQHRCLLCATTDLEAICSNCQHYLTQAQYNCRRCGIPLETKAPHCGECLKSAPAFDETYSAYLYQAPLDKLINEFKHQHNLIAGKALSLLFCKAVYRHYKTQQIDLPQWILPTPLHWRRQWQRGFNQAVFLSTDLSRHLGINIMQGAKKNLYTSSQEGLPRHQRLNNLGNSFSLKQKLYGESIAIVDDVMTTGATANSLARTLKKAGAGKVSIWALARTPKQ